MRYIATLTFIVIVLTIFAILDIKNAGATEIDGQWDRLEVFDDNNCPIHYHIPDNDKRRILSMGPPDCTPIHLEPHHSIWPAGCFIWITKLGYGLESILYSSKCEISITDPIYEEGV